ncbi:MAG: hypothetical protein CM1200mP22_03260 [Dehalococcoidia bacterium]|nr:MAG: hypothetical protein CM1200mP22_03260 [Dehalococcoidia bacterium]
MFDSADMFRAFNPHRGKSIVLVTGTWAQTGEASQKTRNETSHYKEPWDRPTLQPSALRCLKPHEKVVLFDSEGCLQMNMGILGTIAGMKPKNFVHFLMDNGVYAPPGTANTELGEHQLRRDGQ